MRLTEEVVRDFIQRAVVTWNAGKIAEFTAKHAEDVVMIGSRVIRGHNELFEAYVKAYPTQAEMGTLQMEFVHLTITDEMASGVVSWVLEKPNGDKELGHSLLTIIIQDRQLKFAYDQTVVPV